MWNKIKKLFDTAWDSIRTLFSSTFDILKNGIIALVGAIYEWSVKIITSLGSIIWSLIKGLGKILLDGLNYLYEKALDWIIKW